MRVRKPGSPDIGMSIAENFKIYTPKNESSTRTTAFKAKVRNICPVAGGEHGHRKQKLSPKEENIANVSGAM